MAVEDTLTAQHVALLRALDTLTRFEALVRELERDNQALRLELLSQLPKDSIAAQVISMAADRSAAAAPPPSTLKEVKLICPDCNQEHVRISGRHHRVVRRCKGCHSAFISARIKEKFDGNVRSRLRVNGPGQATGDRVQGRQGSTAKGPGIQVDERASQGGTAQGSADAGCPTPRQAGDGRED